MAHSQRQKKRSAQFKKKHFDAKGRGQGGKGGEERKKQEQGSSLAGEEVKRAGLEKGGSTQTSQLDEKKDIVLDKKYEGGQSYSRRKLISNWDRYTNDSTEDVVISSETEDQLQQRLIQLLDLPPAGHATKWQQEKEEEEESSEGVLSLNVAQLANDLRAVSVSDRLGLSQRILEQYGVAENDLIPPPTESNSSPLPPLVERALIPSRLREDVQSFDFTVPPAAVSSVRHDTDTTDTDLDSLLSSSRPHPSDSDHTHFKSSATPNQSLIPNPTPTRSSPTTDELDDILDDLLL